MVLRKTAVGSAALVLAAGVLASAPAPARAEPGFTGLQIQGMDPMFADALGMGAAAGVLVRDVALGGPAGQAGVLRGDLIVAFDGEDIKDIRALVSAVNKTRPGGTYAMTVRRADGRETELTLKLTKRPPAWQVDEKLTGEIPEHGLVMASLTQQMRGSLSVPWGVFGVGVTGVNDPSEPGFKTDLRRGEVIVQVNQRGVWLPGQVIDAYGEAKAEGRKSVMLLVDGAGGPRFSVLTVPQQ